MQIESLNDRPLLRPICYASNGLGMDVHLDSENPDRVRPEVRVCYHLHFVASIRDVDALARVITLRIATSNYQAVEATR